MEGLSKTAEGAVAQLPVCSFSFFSVLFPYATVFEAHYRFDLIESLLQHTHTHSNNNNNNNSVQAEESFSNSPCDGVCVFVYRMNQSRCLQAPPSWWWLPSTSVQPPAVTPMPSLRSRSASMS